MGLFRVPPLTQDEEEFQEDLYSEATSIDGVPENGTITIDADWTTEEAEQHLADGSKKVSSEDYTVDFPGDELPLVVNAGLHRDVIEFAENNGLTDVIIQSNEELSNYTGLAALWIAISLRGNAKSRADRMELRTFRIDMATTYPDLSIRPSSNASYDPQNKQIEWEHRVISPEDTQYYLLVGPIDQLLGLDRLSANLRGRLPAYTMSGLSIAGLFDESGHRFHPREDPDPIERLNFTASIEIEPEALQTKARERSEAEISVPATPMETFDRLVTICRRNDITIKRRNSVGEASPAPDRQGVFVVSRAEGNDGSMEVRKVYGDRGVVYGDIVVEGEFTPTTQQQEMTSFEDTDHTIVRADEGGIEQHGQSTIEVSARSASPELNSEFIQTIEDAFLGGEF